MTGRLEGKVAVITGAASGIGRSAAELFVAEGARVVAADIDDAAGADLRSKYDGSLTFLHADVTQEEDVAATVETAVREYGALHIMVNNAGATGDYSPIVELTADGFSSTLDLVIRSIVLGHKYAARQFIAQGTGGSIVSTTSAAGIQGGWSPAAYTVAKHGVTGIVRQASAELGRHRIRSNAIAPGITMTPLLIRGMGVRDERASEFTEFLEERFGPTIPLGRLGQPSDLAEAALWFASDASSFVTGQVLAVDGGATEVYAGAFITQAADAMKEFFHR